MRKVGKEGGREGRRRRKEESREERKERGKEERKSAVMYVKLFLLSYWWLFEQCPF